VGMLHMFLDWNAWAGFYAGDGEASEDLGQKRLILVGSGIGAGLDILLMGWA
jgi:hypothetical protein